MNSRRFSTLPAIAVLAIVYFVSGKLGLKLAFLNASASPVWPPTGIALAAVVLLGYRMWPAIFLAAFRSISRLRETSELPGHSRREIRSKPFAARGS